MQTLNNAVIDSIKGFICNNAPFTTLDLLNKVRLSIPFANHKEVSDLVKYSFSNEIEPYNYNKSLINITLSNGSIVVATLYHSLYKTNDLDNYYAEYKKSKVSMCNNSIKKSNFLTKFYGKIVNFFIGVK